VEKLARFGVRAGRPVPQVVEDVRETVGHDEADIVGGADRNLELAAGSRERLGGAGDGLGGLWFHDRLLLG
jgi:hypothetical protein